MWLSLAALVVFVLKTWGLLAWMGLTEDSYDQLVSLVIAALTAFGVLNNPTDKSSF